MANVPAGTTKVAETSNDQVPAEAAAVPEDITTFYDKMDKEDEDEEEEQELKTVSFEVNQVCAFRFASSRSTRVIVAEYLWQM